MDTPRWLFGILFSLGLCFGVELPCQAADEHELEMFNGMDLTGWVVEGQATYKDKEGQEHPTWSVENSLITCADGSGFGFLRYDLRQFSDFRLHVDFRMSTKCNSGVGIRTCKFTGPKETRPSMAAYEIQIFDDSGKTPDVHSTAALYGYVAPTSLPTKAAEEWNSMDIECVGTKIKVTLNGTLVQDVDQATVDKLKNKPLSGYLSLQNHGHKVEFRNVRLKDLASAK